MAVDINQHASPIGRRRGDRELVECVDIAAAGSLDRLTASRGKCSQPSSGEVPRLANRLDLISADRRVVSDSLRRRVFGPLKNGRDGQAHSLILPQIATAPIQMAAPVIEAITSNSADVCAG